MATIRDIEIGNSYRGDPILGGRYSQGVTIDSTPLQRLATFAYYRDRDMWVKKVADDKAAAKEIADLTAYDISSPMPQYTDYLIAKKNEAKEFLEKNPNALYYDRDRKGYQKFHEIVGDFERARKAANTSDVIYNARKQTIDMLPQGARKEYEKLALDNSVKKLFENGIDYALNNPLASSEIVDPDKYKIPKLAITKRVFVVNDKNGTQISKVEFGDLDNLDAQAAGAWFGLQEPLDVTTDKFKQLSKDEQELAIARDQVVHEKRIGIQSTANTFNGMLAAIKKANPDVKIENVSTDGLPETIRENIISTNEFNRQVGELNRLTGQKYKRINLDDGLSGEEVMKLEWFQGNGQTLYSEEDKKIQESEAHRMEIERGKLAIDWAKFNYAKDDDKFGATTVLNEAINILDKGTPVMAEDYDNKGGKKELLIIADPTLLVTFGKIDKDGKNYDVPHEVQYDKENGQLNLVYFKTTKNILTGEENIEYTQSGKRQVDKRIPLDERTWLKHIAKRSFPNKDLGKVNELVDDILTKEGKNRLINLTPKGSNQSNKPKTYTYNGKEVTEQQINDAAKQWNLTPEEYMKKFNIK